MKYHIVKEDDNLHSIAKNYGVSEEDLIEINFNEVFGLGKKIKIPQKRDKNITKNIDDIYVNNIQSNKREDEKYICPFCKNIILIPPKK
jgi:LysM repeat protein